MFEAVPILLISPPVVCIALLNVALVPLSALETSVTVVPSSVIPLLPTVVVLGVNLAT